jgi:dihydrofolate reductase
MAVIADITVSLDGFVTGPDPDLEHGLGLGGEPLHAWAFSDDPVDQRVLKESTDQTGAVVLGRRLFDIVDGPHGWSESVGYGASENGDPPCVVVTAEQPTATRLHRWTFAPDLFSAVGQAAKLAADKDVVLMGGGELIRRAVDAGVVHVLRLHLAPLLLGSGTPLFVGAQRRELIRTRVQVSAYATHLTYEVTP